MSAISFPRQARNVKLPRHEIVNVTPSLAERWLKANTRNRRLYPADVAKLARDMREGRWRFTGEPIKFDWNHVLLDGQHRLSAIVESGVSLQMLVIFDLEPESQELMDIGKSRTVGDVLSLRGESNGKSLGAIARLCWLYDRRALPWHNIRPTHPEIIAYIDDNPEITWALKIYTAARIITAPQSSIAAAYHLCARIDRTMADEFYGRQLTSLTGMKYNDPANALYRAFAKRRDMGQKLTQEEALGYCLLAWNAFRAGRPLTKMQAPKGGWSSDNFPRAS